VNPKEFVVIKNIVIGILGLVFVLGLLGFLLFGARLADVFLPMLISAIGIVAIELYVNRDDKE
jgi:magnesium-transporting ATPase (P-type)